MGVANDEEGSPEEAASLGNKLIAIPIPNSNGGDSQLAYQIAARPMLPSFEVAAAVDFVAVDANLKKLSRNLRRDAVMRFALPRG